MSMGDKFDKLFEKLKEEFQKQTIDITDNLISNLSQQLDEKIKPIYDENTILSKEIGKLKERIEYLERESKRNNIVIFNVGEIEENMNDLLNGIQKKIIDDLNISLEKSEINNIYRVGKRNKDGKRPRPVVVSFVNAWKRDEILRNRKKFTIVYVSEDFPKYVIEKRKNWKLELKKERNNGNTAYLVYDKLLVKPGPDKKEKADTDVSLPGSARKQNQHNKTNSDEKKTDDEINKLFDKPLFPIHGLENKLDKLLNNQSETVEENKNIEKSEFVRQKRKIPSHYY